MTDDRAIAIEWLRDLAAKGGKGVVNNIDARSLGRIADDLEQLAALAAAGRVAGNPDGKAHSAIIEWMREPDYVECASLEWALDWINRRPLALAMYGEAIALSRETGA